MSGSVSPDVYSALDIAQAAGVSETRVLELLARGEVRSVATELGGADPTLASYVSHAEAVRAVRALRQGSTVGAAGALGLGRELFAENVRAQRSTTMPLLVSTSLHVLALATILFVASLGFAVADERTEPVKNPEPIRMVFLAIPGPGGGGGGGGMKMKTPPPRAERKGIEKISSPLPARKLPPPLRPEPKPPEPPKPLEAKQLPPVMAPIPTKQAEPEDREGVLAKAPETKPSQGTGTGGGAGSGQGTGLGPGDGAGVGDGSGGGFGGGPFRPGSGVEPPRLLREVKADYTDEARRANIAGEVELEIIVRRDGTVGDVKVLRGLRGGLN